MVHYKYSVRPNLYHPTLLTGPRNLVNSPDQRDSRLVSLHSSADVCSTDLWLTLISMYLFIKHRTTKLSLQRLIWTGVPVPFSKFTHFNRLTFCRPFKTVRFHKSVVDFPVGDESRTTINSAPIHPYPNGLQRQKVFFAFETKSLNVFSPSRVPGSQT